MSGRTLPPTPRRLREARRRGNVPVSRVLIAVAATSCGGAAAGWSFPSAVRKLSHLLATSLAVAGRDGAPVGPALIRAAVTALEIALPPMVAAAAGAAAVGLVQTRGNFSWEAASPRWQRIAPEEGLRRLCSPAAAGGAALALAWSVLSLWVAARAARPLLPSLASAPRLAPGGAAALLDAAARRVALPLLGVLAVAALVDVALAIRRHRRALRMTRSEVERDHREDEGDPRLRAERRRRHAAAMTASRRVACVVVNPTHIAVGLAHDPGSDVPPAVAWMASGTRAAEYRRLARRAGIPVIADVPLARSLFRLAEVGDLIPEELHEAVAVVLARIHLADRSAGPEGWP